MIDNNRVQTFFSQNTFGVKKWNKNITTYINIEQGKVSSVLENINNWQIVVSCTYEEGKPALMQDLKFLRQMIEDDNQFLEVTALGSQLAWRQSSPLSLVESFIVLRSHWSRAS